MTLPTSNRIFVHGTGAVSPAGWTSTDLSAALAAGQPIAASPQSAGPGRSAMVRRVPAPAVRPAFLSQARLRRSSAVSHFAVSAALEALGPDAASVVSGDRRLGIVCAVMTGGVNYTRRFFAEVLEQPATASPLLFPETVFNAPAAHLGAVLNATGPNLTLLADQTGFLQGLAVACGWLMASDVDGCLVVATEESDWLTAEALRHFSRSIETAEGSGAVYLSREPAPVELGMLTDPELYQAGRSRAAALESMRRQLPSGTASDLLFDSATGPDPAGSESGAWRDWPGTRVSPRRVLGEGFAAAGAWPCVAAIRALEARTAARALVSVVGSNLQAQGACWVAAPVADGAGS